MLYKGTKNPFCFICRSRGSASQQMASNPVSLQNQCLVYIICFLELFPVDYLALLPAAIRQRLLESLPPADLCRLERTKAAEDLASDGIWKSHTLKYPVLLLRFPTYKFKNYYNFQTEKDYFFAHVFFTLFNHRELRLSLFTSKRQARQKKQEFLNNVYRPLWQILTSLDSMEPKFHALCSLFLKAPVPMSPPTPLRYLDFQSPDTANELFKSFTLLVPNTCRYYPKVLQIDLSTFSSTMISWYCRRNRDFCLEMFGQVEFLYLTYTYRKICIGDPLESNYLFKELCDSAAMILPAALPSLQVLVIEANRNDVMGFVMEGCMSHICHSAAPLKLEQLILRVVNIHKGFHSHVYGGRPGPPLCRHWNHKPNAPLCLEHDKLLQSLSPFFTHPRFSSLTLDGIALSTHSQARALADILRAFLTSPTAHKQYLILHEVKDPGQCSNDVPASISPLRDLQYKSLQIRKTVLSQSIISWLLEKSRLCLSTLELALEDKHVPVAIAPAELPKRSENLQVESLALHSILTGSIHQLQQVLTMTGKIKTLDLSSCSLGVSGYTLLLPTLLSKAVSVRELNLAANCLGRMGSMLLEKVFDVLFGLPQLQDLSLDLSDNQLTPHHFSMMYISWTKKSPDKKLKRLVCGDNYCSDNIICRAMAIYIH